MVVVWEGHQGCGHGSRPAAWRQQHGVVAGQGWGTALAWPRHNREAACRLPHGLRGSTAVRWAVEWSHQGAMQSQGIASQAVAPGQPWEPRWWRCPRTAATGPMPPRRAHHVHHRHARLGRHAHGPARVVCLRAPERREGGSLPVRSVPLLLLLLRLLRSCCRAWHGLATRGRRHVVRGGGWGGQWMGMWCAPQAGPPMCAHSHAHGCQHKHQQAPASTHAPPRARRSAARPTPAPARPRPAAPRAARPPADPAAPAPGAAPRRRRAGGGATAAARRRRPAPARTAGGEAAGRGGRRGRGGGGTGRWPKP
jgi:hypothetical protein